MFQMYSGLATWYLKCEQQHKISGPGCASVFVFTIAVVSGNAVLIVTTQKYKRDRINI